MTMIAGKPQVRLRALEPEDLDILYRYENDSSLWEVGTTIAPFSRKQLYDYIAGYSNDIYAERQLRLMVDDAATGETVGTVDITDFSPADMRAGWHIDRSGAPTARLRNCGARGSVRLLSVDIAAASALCACAGRQCGESGIVPAMRIQDFRPSALMAATWGELSRRDSAAATVRLMRQPTFRLRRTF